MKVADFNSPEPIKDKLEEKFKVAVSKLSLWARLKKKCTALYIAYLRLQIYNRGSYSIERFHDFQTYNVRTSSWRIFLYCMLVTLPALVMTITVELMPLESPLDPWDQNIVFWIRVFLMGFVLCMSFTYQAIPFVASLQNNPCKLVLISSSAALFTNGMNMLAGAYWRFPVPLAPLFAAPILIGSYVVSFYTIVGPEGFNALRAELTALKTQLTVFSVHGAVLFVYAVYNAIFQAAPPTEKIFCIGALPLIKIALKNMYAWAIASKIESVPEIATFSVEVFNALYVSLCMQTAESLWVSIVVIGYDAMQILISMLKMEYQSKTLLQVLKQDLLEDVSNKDLLSIVAKLCQNPKVRERVNAMREKNRDEMHRSNAKINPLQIGIEEVVDGTLGIDSKCSANFTSDSMFLERASNQRVQQTMNVFGSNVENTPIVPLQPTLDENFDLKERPNFELEKARLVHEALKLFYHAEYRLITEFVEVIIPIVYIVHTSVLFHLPNAIYYSHTRNLTSEGLKTAAINILLYALMEALSLAAFHYMLKRQFRLSPMCLLGYTLETQWRQIVGRTTFFVYLILQFTVIHHGFDMTFKFNWAEQLGAKTNEET